VKNEEFYIGYQPEAPKKISGFVKRIILGIFILLVAAGALLAYYQRKFSSGIFEFGSNKEYNGIYTNIPVPSIKIINQKDATGNLINTNLVLVGFGKHGAESAIEEFEKRNHYSLTGMQVKFKGDLIFGKGKFLLSLSDENPVAGFSESNQSADKMIPDGDISIQGEIIDPKCYFGVMKPGRGKVHRECAIRCISGGIPPVFRTHKSEGGFEYFLIKGKNGEAINDQVLPFVADHISITGKLFQWGDWKVIYADDFSGK